MSKGNKEDITCNRPWPYRIAISINRDTWLQDGFVFLNFYVFKNSLFRIIRYRPMTTFLMIRKCMKLECLKQKDL
jgi:hypothetical protein